MKVRDIMVKAPKTAHPDTSLATAADTMWAYDCGALPVVDDEYEVVGFITDRDICITLGTRNQLASEVLVRDVMSKRVYACAPDDDIHTALETLEKGKVRRLPVINPDGKLVGLITLGDITLHAEKKAGRNVPDLTSDEVVEAFQGLRVRQLTETVPQL
jgi:CBS domain-containing protein